MNRAGRFAALLFLGTLLVQAAWILAVPPYNGIDEIDHTYRASGVAAGEWRLTQMPAEGRGLVTSVPTDVVAAGSQQCHSLDYMQPDNCDPISVSDGRARVASAAGAYHPLFYALVGAAGAPFEGVAADYAMRAFASLVCALLVAAAGWVLASSGAGLWTRLAFVVTLTPGLLYTTVMPAPNGIEIAAALLLWSALLSFARVTPGTRAASLLLLTAVASAVVVATPRVLGPIWVLLVVGTAVLFVGWRVVVAAWTHHAGLVVAGSAAVAAAAAGSVWWTLSAELTDASSGLTAGGGVEDLELGAQPVVWLLQVVGAFPFRDGPAPMATYAVYTLLVVGLIGAGLKSAGLWRERLAIGGAVATAALLPVVLTYLTAAEQGVMWQGRYGLPLIVGILPMCGLVLDRHEVRTPELRRLVVTGCAVMLAVAHAWSVWQVAGQETARGVYDPAAWVTLPALVLAGLTVGAVVVLMRAVATGGPPPPTGVAGPEVEQPAADAGQSRPRLNADSRSWRE